MEEYRRHTKGNSLYLNHGDGKFRETDQARMGRWSWAGEGIDWDADGSPEILIAAGMITNDPPFPGVNPLLVQPLREPMAGCELMSFFWRQVAAHSSADGSPSKGYEDGWNAINQYIREDCSWNGHERNVVYARRDGKYVDVSGVSGLDVAADSRSFAAVDIDGDGRLGLVLKNRLGPQVRVFRNQAARANNVCVLALEGVESNRDAIGAWVTVEFGDGRRSGLGVTAGSGYLCQHTKRLHIGLGQAEQADRVEIRWPGGKTGVLENLAAGQLHRIVEGQGVVESTPFEPRPIAASVALFWEDPKPEQEAEAVWLLEPVALPEKRGPGFVVLNPQPMAEDAELDVVPLADDPERAAWYTLFARYLLDYRGPLELPLTLLVDDQARAHCLYRGVPDSEARRRDLAAMDRPDRQSLALPFTGTYYGRPTRNYFRHGAAFFQAGFFEQALPYLSQTLAQNPDNYKARLASGQIYLQAGRVDLAEEHIERAAQLRPDAPEVWNNLGGISMNRERWAEAAERLEKALALDPQASYAVANLAQAYAKLGRSAEAEKNYRLALELDPDDAETANQFGLFLARSGRPDEAKEKFQQAIEKQRDYASAINNLAVLYTTLDQPQEAIAALRYGIRVAPQDERLYMNLARIYVQGGDRARARSVIDQLLAAKPDSEQARRALEELNRP